MRYLAAAFAPALAFTLVATAPAAQAETRAFRTDYSVTLLGLPVASARFDSSFEGDRFRIRGSVSSSGVGRLFDDTKGTTSVEGTIRQGAVLPSAFKADYVSGRKKGRTAIRFAGDAVETVVNEPDKKRNPKSWVAVSEGHLKAVLDPLSSAIVPAASAKAAGTCFMAFPCREIPANL